VHERAVKEGNPMLSRIAAALLLSLGLGQTWTSPISAQEPYPSRPITLIVPWGAGGGADRLGRIASKLLEPILKVSLPVINVPGATGQTGLTKLITSAPDGYTIEVMTADTYPSFLGESSRFKQEQIKALAIMIQQPSGFFVSADRPWKNWDDVVKAAQERNLKVAVTGFGSPDDFTVRYMRSKGLKLDSVPFAEPGLRYSSIIGGQSDLLYEQAGDVRSFLVGNQMRPILFFSAKKFEPFPEVPFSKALGYDITLPQFRAMIVRADTDPAKVKMLADNLQTIARDPEFIAYLDQQMGDPNSFVGETEAEKFMKNWLDEARAVAAAAPK
jgi:tripartite-type tricarboxylate transporter receptor subunit TctC